MLFSRAACKIYRKKGLTPSCDIFLSKNPRNEGRERG
nr:MAG TPA: hypothetical protein [Caudoviricetes sp.]